MREAFNIQTLIFYREIRAEIKRYKSQNGKDKPNLPNKTSFSLLEKFLKFFKRSLVKSYENCTYVCMYSTTFAISGQFVHVAATREPSVPLKIPNETANSVGAVSTTNVDPLFRHLQTRAGPPPLPLLPVATVSSVRGSCERRSWLVRNPQLAPSLRANLLDKVRTYFIAGMSRGFASSSLGLTCLYVRRVLNADLVIIVLGEEEADRYHRFTRGPRSFPRPFPRTLRPSRDPRAPRNACQTETIEREKGRES